MNLSGRLDLRRCPQSGELLDRFCPQCSNLHCSSGHCYSLSSSSCPNGSHRPGVQAFHLDPVSSMPLEFLGPDAIALLGFLVSLISSLKVEMPAALQMAQDHFQKALEASSSEELNQQMLKESAKISQSTNDFGSVIFNYLSHHSMLLSSE